MEKLYFITSNQNKFNELKKIYSNLEILDIDLAEIQSLNSIEVIEHKLLEAFRNYDNSKNLLVEDTSLYLNALNGFPGPLIKWFLKSLGENGIYELVDKYKNYKVKANTIIAFARNINEIYYFESELYGKIVAPRGNNGFAWDLIFELEDIGKTLAELSIEEKNKISMRASAFKKLLKFLNK